MVTANDRRVTDAIQSTCTRPMGPVPTLVVPVNDGHPTKRVLFASEVPNGKFTKVETEVQDDGS